MVRPPIQDAQLLVHRSRFVTVVTPHSLPGLLMPDMRRTETPLLVATVPSCIVLEESLLQGLLTFSHVSFIVDICVHGMGDAPSIAHRSQRRLVCE